jgi:hypothetical protein
MNQEKSIRRIFWMNVLIRILWGLGMIAFCIGLDVTLHKLGIVKTGYSHPHGFGTLRQLLGWLGGWSIGWILMRLFVNINVRKFNHKKFKHWQRAAIWAGFALLVLLLLPVEN